MGDRFSNISTSVLLIGALGIGVPALPMPVNARPASPSEADRQVFNVTNLLTVLAKRPTTVPSKTRTIREGQRRSNEAISLEQTEFIEAFRRTFRTQPAKRKELYSPPGIVAHFIAYLKEDKSDVGVSRQSLHALDELAAYAISQSQTQKGFVNHFARDDIRFDMIKYVNKSNQPILTGLALGILARIAPDHKDVAKLFVQRALTATSAYERKIITDYLTLDRTESINSLLTVASSGKNSQQAKALAMLGEVYSRKQQQVTQDKTITDKVSAMKPYEGLRTRLGVECKARLFDINEVKPVKAAAARTLVQVAENDPETPIVLNKTGYDSLIRK